jgi:fluoride ion exporter CrcB/FEX
MFGNANKTFFGCIILGAVMTMVGFALESIEMMAVSEIMTIVCTISYIVVCKK